jgi:hypothetical protein
VKNNISFTTVMGNRKNTTSKIMAEIVLSLLLREDA